MERLDDYLDQQDRQEAIDDAAEALQELSKVWGADNTDEWWRMNGHFDRLPWEQTADVIRRKIASVQKQARWQELPY